jgi:crotonobetainyl-CoA:carnitine CoA-transferase CaiB-like acyl-CoA transferase
MKNDVSWPQAVGRTDDAPLVGVRVLEMGQWVAGPYAASILADFGAEVIKIEPPGHPDLTRSMGSRDPRDPGRSPFFVVISRNKKGVALDIRSTEGREIFLRLVEKSDVIVENFRPGTLESWDLDFATLSDRNPNVLLLRISGYGQTGPYRDRPGVDRIAQAFAGVTFVTGHPGGDPVKCGVTLADFTASMMGAMGVLLAYIAQLRDGAGQTTAQVIDVSLYDPLLQMLADIPANYVRDGAIRQRVGNTHDHVSPGDLYRSSDGKYIVLSAAGDSLFHRLAMAMNRLDWLERDEYSSGEGRIRERKELDRAIQEWTSQRTGTEVIETLVGAGVPATLVTSISDLMSDPHVAEREDFTAILDAVIGEVVLPAPKPLLSRTPGAIRSTAPSMGEHTGVVLREVLGMSELELRRLEDLAIIECSPMTSARGDA